MYHIVGFYFRFLVAQRETSPFQHGIRLRTEPLNTYIKKEDKILESFTVYSKCNTNVLGSLMDVVLEVDNYGLYREKLMKTLRAVSDFIALV